MADEEKGTGSLSDQAYARLFDMIVALELPPGGALSEQELSRRLDIGRTPIREALRHLIREGLVVSYPNRGLVISEISQQSQLRLLEVRRELDRLMMRLAAERASAVERQQFADIAAAMRASMAGEPDYAEFMRQDERFNRLVVQASRNEFAAKAAGLMMGMWARFWNRYYREVGDVPLVAKLHAEIADAIVARDAAEAAKASDRLIDYIADFTRRTLDH